MAGRILQRLLRDGLLVGAAFTLVVVLSLLADPLVWLADYPPQIRALVPADLSASPVVYSLTLVGLLLVIGGGFVYAERGLERELERHLGFLPRFAYLWLLFQIVNLVDVVIVDWLVFTAWTPDFVVIPGTQGSRGYDDYGFHWSESFLRPEPWIASLVVAGLMAAVTGWRWSRRRR